MWPMFFSLCLALSRKPARKAVSRCRPAFRRPLLEMLEYRTLPSTFVVTTGLDNGNDANPTPGSLRAAILASNQSPGTAAYPDLIAFNIPTSDPSYNYGTTNNSFDVLTPAQGLCCIPNLPDLTAPVIIDGYTQPGAQVNTLAQGDNAILKIVLNGSPVYSDGTQQETQNTLGVDGLNLIGGNITIRGLVINNFTGAGINIASNYNTIAGDFIGTDVTGEHAQGNGNMGVNADESDTPHNYNRIGTFGNGLADFADRNMISASTNTYNGIGVNLNYGSSQNVVAGNYIGTDASGTQALGNTYGVVLFGGLFPSGYNQIGGDGPNDTVDGNLISGNLCEGIVIGADTNDTIYGNDIGTDVTGTRNLGNGHNGVLAITAVIVDSANNDLAGPQYWLSVHQLFPGRLCPLNEHGPSP